VNSSSIRRKAKRIIVDLNVEENCQTQFSASRASTICLKFNVRKSFAYIVARRALTSKQQRRTSAGLAELLRSSDTVLNKGQNAQEELHS
jgi:hypothetical protein